jgi:hypothetical protein
MRAEATDRRPSRCLARGHETAARPGRGGDEPDLIVVTSEEPLLRGPDELRAFLDR